MERHEMLRTTAEHVQTRGDRLLLRLGFDLWREDTDEEERLCIKVPKWFPKWAGNLLFRFMVKLFKQMTAEEYYGSAT